MADQQEVLASILESFPLAELTSVEEKEAFIGIKNRLLSGSDVQQELKMLYRVNGFSDFATGLLWVVERSAQTPDATGISSEDETLLLSSFRRAFGESGTTPEPKVGAVESVSDSGTGGGGGGEAEQYLATALERFSEAVQGGTEERESLHTSLLALAEGPGIQEVGGEGAEFAGYLADFLKYISENQLFDDIRVINIFSNISSGVAQWANTPPEGRAGLLEESMGMVRDFKSQFE
jgi:hypothetical protein